MLHRLRPATAVLTAGLLCGALSGCGSDEKRDAPTSASSGYYPVTVENCGADVTFEKAPERTVVLKSSSVPFMQELGVLDRATARAGQYPDEYFDEQTRSELADIPSLTDELDSSGHLKISKEVVIAEEPDLVLGEVDNLTRDTLEDVDIPLLEEPALCAKGTDTAPNFDDIYAQLEMYGKVFGRQSQADAASADLRKRVEKATAQAAQGKQRTAAVLYPTVGGGTTYAYGTQSMAHPQLEAAGLRNVFADTDERVFEVTLEELLGRDPDVLILLHSEGDAAPVEQAITDLPGAERLTAVKNDDVMTQLFNFAEPPTPLAVTGLEQIVERFGSAQ